MRVLLLLLASLPLFGVNNVYVGINSAGANDGTSCAARKNAAYFNTSGNWSATPTGIQIGPATTVHFCGTDAATINTTPFTFQGSGTAGNPITFLFETGADLNSPAFNVNGAINCNSKSYLTIDGGTPGNGIIRATANGDSLANQISTDGIYCYPASDHFTVKNMYIHDLYIKTEGSANTTDDSICVGGLGEFTLVTQNTISHCASGAASGGYGHQEVSYNTFSFCQHCISAGTSTILIDDLKFHDNDIGGGAYLWDQTGNAYHHNAIIIICESSLGGSCITNLQIYNNRVTGIWSRSASTHTTGVFFFDDYPPMVGDQIANALIYNNLIQIASGDVGTANGMIVGVHGGMTLAYNTFVGQGGNSCVNGDKNTGELAKNNIFSTCGTGIYLNSGSAASGTVPIDYNLYYMIANWNFNNGADNFSQWQTLGGECLCDLHSINGSDPLLNPNGTLQAGSPARGAGVSLAGLGIAALATGMPATVGVGGACGGGCLARAGTPDLGALPFSGASPSLPTVTTTTATSITTTTASSGGNVTSDGGASVTVRGVCRSTSANPTTSATCTSDGTGTGAFTSSLTGMSASTLYHIRAYATNTVGTSYGNDLTFTTSSGASAPSVTTTTATSITSTTASSGGTVTATGGSSVTSEGVCYATTSNPTTPCTSNGTSTPFTSAISGLSVGTLYHYRAFATNATGTGYGSDLTFTTTSANPPGIVIGVGIRVGASITQ